jgi:hypothetical protein
MSDATSCAALPTWFSEVFMTHRAKFISPARNDGGDKSGHWLTLRLIGDITRNCPRDAIGATVFLTANGRRLGRDFLRRR